MKRNFSSENFEQFLRRNADGVRMRPSTKVWKGVSRHLNRRWRRTGFILGFSLLLLTGLGYYYSSYPDLASPATAVNKPAFTKPGALIPTAGTQNRSGTIISAGNHSVNTANRKHISLPQPELSTPTRAAHALEDILTAQNAPEEFKYTIVDSYMGRTAGENLPSVAEEKTGSATEPLTIESVSNFFQPARERKTSFQVYFTPTVSYRKLSDNNIDNVVTHKPDFGFELGLAAKYRLSRNLRLRGGFQFNVNRYDIKTYSSTTQLATIRLNSGNGVNYMRTTTNYNNFSGYQADWLHNFYLQVSAPIGLEVKLRGDDRMQFGVASTLQPTYLLGDRAYLISADYKNYAQVPRLIRRWNLNSHLETFVSYSTGHLKWQVGPQVRYQLLSSYVKKYPVKENLFDFGLKVGISVNR